MLPLLQIKNLTVEFPGTENAVTALQDFSLELNRGEILAVVGESGSGKSVMSLAVMNLLSPSARIKNGSILFSSDGNNAIELLGMPEGDARLYRGSGLAMIFQEPMTSLNPVMTCGEQLMEPLTGHRRINRKEAKEEAIRLLEKVQISNAGEIFKRYPHQLSGGQRQRVMIAMSISCRPAVLICDEPTTALDVRVQKTILDLLNEIRKAEQIGMIFITHDLGIVADLADRAIVMWKGRSVESGPVKELFSHPQHPYTRGLLQCRPSLHHRGERLPVVSDFLKEGRASDISQLTIRTESAGVIPVSGGEPLMRVSGLSVRFGGGKDWLGREKKGFDALTDISFDVYRGETLGLVGESGSGKSTLGRALLGLLKPSAGAILYGKHNLAVMGRRDLLAFRRNIQIVFQDPYSSLNPRRMIGPAIMEALTVHTPLVGVLKRQKVMDLLIRVDLKPEHYGRYPFAFSGGQRQRIVIARALVLDPGFVVFDESVSALDVSVQAQILNLIRDLRETMGFTAVFISHDLSVVRWLCDRVIVLENGRIVEVGEAETVYSNPQSPYTQALLDAIPGKSLLAST